MTDYKSGDLAEVETLLASRQRITEWLHKLDAAGSKAPTSVRDRVRGDYQARLSQVVDQLRSHSDIISSTLSGLRSQASDLERLKAHEQETLAEAELRFAVGEYREDEWKQVESDATAKLRGLEGDLGRLSGEIGRLHEVLSQIVPAPTAARQAASAPAEPISVVRDEPRSAPAQPAPVEVVEAPRFTARGGARPRERESGPARTIQFPPRESSPARESGGHREPAPSSLDELTFLKSMTLDARPAGGAPASAQAAVESKPERAAPTVAKTLKCGECGSLNRPTEWYCERCGAELAAV